MGEQRDFYEVLGVARRASVAEITDAYRKLAIRFHPDKNPGDKAAEARFKEVSAAYDVLSDADKRKNYDEFGADSLHSGFDAARARAYQQAGAGFGGGRGPGGSPPRWEARSRRPWRGPEAAPSRSPNCRASPARSRSSWRPPCAGASRP